MHDVSVREGACGIPEFIQITTKHHKAARSAEKKSLLLPILASSSAVVQDEWIATWMRLRKQAGLKVSGVFNGALQPAPDINRQGSWMQRPLSCRVRTHL